MNYLKGGERYVERELEKGGFRNRMRVHRVRDICHRDDVGGFEFLPDKMKRRVSFVYERRAFSDIYD